MHPEPHHENPKTDASYDGQVEIHERPKGLKGFYTHPITQTTMLGLVCFMCPGLFNALNGLGGGGRFDASTGNKANTALYSTFAIGAFFAGSVNNKIGPRWTLFLGGMGYSLYIGAFLATNIHETAGPFVIAAGAILGLCAGLLWTAQGALMLSYPTEHQKGKFIALFWTIFNLGAVVGASIALGQNFGSSANSVGNATYIVFLVLTGIGFLIPLIMVDPHKMIRTDGTKVKAAHQLSWKAEFYGLWHTLRSDPWIVLLFPMFMASNWFTTWQFNGFNGAGFDIGGRSLNNEVYWVSQIVGAIFMGFVLDTKMMGRRARAFTGWAILLVMVFVVHGWGYHYQKQYTRESVMAADALKTHRMSIYDKPYVGRVIFYIFCGLMDAMWQTAAYWIMGAMSNDLSKLAHFAGFYKSIQSAGAAITWGLDTALVPYMNQFAATWAILVAGLLFAFPMLYLRVKDHTEEPIESEHQVMEKNEFSEHDRKEATA